MHNNDTFFAWFRNMLFNVGGGLLVILFVFFAYGIFLLIPYLIITAYGWYVIRPQIITHKHDANYYKTYTNKKIFASIAKYWVVMTFRIAIVSLTLPFIWLLGAYIKAGIDTGGILVGTMITVSGVIGILSCFVIIFFTLLWRTKPPIVSDFRRALVGRY